MEEGHDLCARAAFVRGKAPGARALGYALGACPDDSVAAERAGGNIGKIACAAYRWRTCRAVQERDYLSACAWCEW